MRKFLGPGRPALISCLSLTLVASAFVPTAAQAKTLGREVAYPLRHSFSMAVGLPGAGKHEPTSCYDVPGSGEYACRILAGVEETGDKRNLYVADDSVLEKGNDPTFGTTLVNKDGIQFEGCDAIDDWSWECDYAGRMHVSGRHYESSGYVWRVFWSWQKHTASQAGCAASIVSLWKVMTKGGFLGVLAACQNGPMERP